MSDVKRYDPINNDGTCGVCIEDADYGAYVEYADFAALEAELAKLRAGQECQTLNQRAFIGTLLNSFPLLNDDGLDETEHHCEWHIQQERKRLHTIVDAARLSLSIATPQPSAVPSGWKLVPVEPTPEMAKVSTWDMNSFYSASKVWADMLAAAPSAPATVQGDADNYRWLREHHNDVNSDIGVYDGVNILATRDGELDLDAAIAAARKGEGE